MKYESSAVFEFEIYGEVLDDDGEKYFDPEEICLFIGNNRLVLPKDTINLLDKDMIKTINDKAMENFNKEHSEF